MGGPLSVTFSDIYMIKTKSQIVIPRKPLFYRPYVDDIYNRRKKFKHDELIEKLNNDHPKIKLTIEFSLTKFLNASLHLNNGSTTLKFTGKQQNNPHLGHRKSLKGTNLIWY